MVKWKENIETKYRFMNMASRNAVLRCVNGSWFCPKCFISCSTKGNLKQHIERIHSNCTSSETTEGNSSKIIILEEDHLVECCHEGQNGDEEPNQFTSSQ